MWLGCVPITASISIAVIAGGSIVDHNASLARAGSHWRSGITLLFRACVYQSTVSFGRNFVSLPFSDGADRSCGCFGASLFSRNVVSLPFRDGVCRSFGSFHGQALCSTVNKPHLAYVWLWVRDVLDAALPDFRFNRGTPPTFVWLRFTAKLKGFPTRHTVQCCADGGNAQEVVFILH